VTVLEAETHFFIIPTVSLISGNKVDPIVFIDPRFTKDAMSISAEGSYILDPTPELALCSEKAEGCH